MPSDHETASREQQVEALSLVMLRAYYDDPDETFEHHDREMYDDLSRAILDSTAMRDLLAEAKAEAWDGGRTSRLDLVRHPTTRDRESQPLPRDEQGASR